MKHIPNVLSVFRMLMIPIIVWQMAAGNMFFAGVLLIVSFVTDFLDGWLARRNHWISNVGKVLDPAADKMTQVAVSITLIAIKPQFWWLFALLITKDAVMGILALWVVGKGVTMQGAQWSGKIATFVYYFTVIVIALFEKAPSTLILALLILTGITAVVAGLSYIPNFKQYRQQAKAGQEKTK